MLEELKKINRLGDKGDIILFLKSVIGRQRLYRKDIQKICEYSSERIFQNINSILLYCEYLELIIVEEKIYISPVIGRVLDDPIKLNDTIISNTISKMFSVQAFEQNMFIFDVLEKRFIFKNEKLSLDYFIFRNLLISQGFFEVIRTNTKFKFFVASQYEVLISSFCKERNKAFTIEQLRKKLEENELAGEMAECFVLSFERKRITNVNLKDLIKRISDIDVGAGYDIVSFNSNNSVSIDRFIEVKAISDLESFYWSKNEYDIAKLKGNEYCLYLVDLKRITDNEYIPMIIKNPANTLFKSDDWLVESQSFHVWHV
ncbi:DUF3883 domain-containing protein [Lacrimispora sphenoides]|uniref:Protein NO VEIN C-terminal domain-containing protein n=1 Tax=Lacrimispora sphenoides JCM 1415 TaxID=1297793 RepID=A0ABY1CHE1_9FIRM|nr:DUF3883 domain-containing protein [Lacrimispora sphenoides]SEU03604.1 protein of unknown function [[Clostridium] sphenoides JCM 1415]SUY48795.1 Uncharacterised protein [Lacrimispora sphenoides]